MFDSREKIALFINGANLFAASKGLGSISITANC
ncbi:hypothetical protein FB009_12735 [Sinorhizobium medicae]|nr:hypothetical protein FB009_12735 [Sinorhizobium medicae]